MLPQTNAKPRQKLARGYGIKSNVTHLHGLKGSLCLFVVVYFRVCCNFFSPLFDGVSSFTAGFPRDKGARSVMQMKEPRY